MFVFAAGQFIPKPTLGPISAEHHSDKSMMQPTNRADDKDSSWVALPCQHRGSHSACLRPERLQVPSTRQQKCGPIRCTLIRKSPGPTRRAPDQSRRDPWRRWSRGEPLAPGGGFAPPSPRRKAACRARPGPACESLLCPPGGRPLPPREPSPSRALQVRRAGGPSASWPSQGASPLRFRGRGVGGSGPGRPGRCRSLPRPDAERRPPLGPRSGGGPPHFFSPHLHMIRHFAPFMFCSPSPPPPPSSNNPTKAVAPAH